MSAPSGSPDYDPNTWKLGYQQRQFGAPGVDNTDDIISGLSNPPTAMLTAKAVVEDSNLPRSTPPT